MVLSTRQRRQLRKFVDFSETLMDTRRSLGERHRATQAELIDIRRRIDAACARYRGHPSEVAGNLVPYDLRFDTTREETISDLTVMKSEMEARLADIEAEMSDLELVTNPVWNLRDSLLRKAGLSRDLTPVTSLSLGMAIV